MNTSSLQTHQEKQSHNLSEESSETMLLNINFGLNWRHRESIICGLEGSPGCVKAFTVSRRIVSVLGDRVGFFLGCLAGSREIVSQHSCKLLRVSGHIVVPDDSGSRLSAELCPEFRRFPESTNLIAEVLYVSHGEEHTVYPIFD
jgi:hypothetical protein